MADEQERWISPHLGAGPGLIKVKGMWFPLIYLKFESDKLEKLEAFQARSDDVWLCSYPKSGTSWLQQIIYLLVRGENDEATKHLNADERFPYIEGIAPVMDKLATAPSPRLVKTHVTVDLIPPSILRNKAKVIYIARNVKDVSVSDYHFHQLVANVDYKGTFQDFYKEFVEGKVCYSRWWEHVAGFGKIKDLENVLFLKYEDLQKDTIGEISKVAKFLDINCEPSQIQRIAELSTFGAMKDDQKVNHSWNVKKGVFKEDSSKKFMRKGMVGDWKNYYSEEMSQEVESLCQKITEPLGLTFEYEI